MNVPNYILSMYKRVQLDPALFNIVPITTKESIITCGNELARDAMGSCYKTTNGMVDTPVTRRTLARYCATNSMRNCGAMFQVQAASNLLPPAPAQVCHIPL